MRNCADSSDESVSACISVSCPSYGFRCAYGACVNGRARCNGVQECADNSDESGCDDKFKDTSNSCPDGGFRCGSGQCVKGQAACDGAIDCDDKSDETVKLCSSTSCPAYGFRCGYGGCIHKQLKCNGDNDCADGSDEEPTMCGPDATSPTKPPISIPTVTQSNVVISGGCLVTLAPFMKAYYQSQPDHVITNGTYVEDGVPIRYKCKVNTILTGGKDINYCFGGTWTDTLPFCQRICSSLKLQGPTIMVTCEYLQRSVLCLEPRPGTVAKISCAFGYQRPERNVQDAIRCGDDGEWDYGVFTCDQVCGTEGAEGVSYIVNGLEVNNTKVPWHVGVYNDIKSRGNFEHSCGGTLLNAKVVISAAHCFWDTSESKMYKAEHFMIGVGKQYRTYNAVEPLPVQKNRIAEIISRPGYADYASLYEADIALLVMSEIIVLHSYVIPICMEYNLSFNDKLVPPNWTGVVAGWGRTSSGGPPSEVLKVLKMPSIELNQCKKSVNPEFRKFITSDKFCGGFTTGASVCNGDSGGGFVFPKEFKSGTVYYLRGLVSAGPKAAFGCDSSQYATFTNIQYYSDLIYEVVTTNAPK